MHIAFAYLLLTLTYFHLEWKILLNIPDSLLDSALALRRKEGENYKLISVWNLVTIQLKHGNSKSFYHGKLETWLSICNLADIFCRAFFSVFSKVIV